jgi:hypothetical protein
MLVEGEFLESDQSLKTRPPTIKTGSGSPTVNADFIGQEYYDYLNVKFYVSVKTGSNPPSGDWTPR